MFLGINPNLILQSEKKNLIAAQKKMVEKLFFIKLKTHLQRVESDRLIQLVDYFRHPYHQLRRLGSMCLSPKGVIGVSSLTLSFFRCLHE